MLAIGDCILVAAGPTGRFPGVAAVSSEASARRIRDDRAASTMIRRT